RPLPSVLVSFKRRSFQISDETREQLTHFSCVARQLIENLTRNVTLIKSYVKLRTNFAARALGDSQKIQELFISSSFKPLRNIRQDRNRCPSDLILQTKVANEQS